MSDFPTKEGKLSGKEIGALLILVNFMKSNSSRPEAARLLHSCCWQWLSCNLQLFYTSMFDSTILFITVATTKLIKWTKWKYHYVYVPSISIYTMIHKVDLHTVCFVRAIYLYMYNDTQCDLNRHTMIKCNHHNVANI